MSNLKYLKGVRTRYSNALGKEIETAVCLLKKDILGSNPRELIYNVSVCSEKLQSLVIKLENQSEKVASAISESDEEFTEEILAQDSTMCEHALDIHSKLKILESELSYAIKIEDSKSASESVSETKESFQMDMKKLFEMQLDLQKEFVKHASVKPKEVNSVKLPKLEISSFNGDKLRWLEFWQTFETSVHKNTNITKIDKFNYLKSKLTDKAKGAITGLALTRENYDVAVEILKERFGDSQEIIDLHYNRIVNLKPTSDSIEGLRYFMDTVDKNLRSLEVLGQNVNQEIFVSVIMSKLPTNVIRHLEMKKGVHVKWTVVKLKEILTEYIVASEKAEKVRRDNPPQRINKVNSSTGAGAYSSPTSEALVTEARDSGRNKRSNKCRYCSKLHWSDECSEFKTVQERKKCLIGSCYRCLKKGHRSNDCKSDKTCVYCSQMNVHHRSLCPKRFGKISNTESVNTVDEICESPNFAPQVEGAVEGAALLSSNEMVLMQTARVRIQCPKEKRETEIRLLLDSGSQRSYISEKLAKSLNLKGETEQEIRLVTFGSQKVKVVKTRPTKLNLVLKDGDVMKITANIVPNITGSIQRRPLNLVDNDGFDNLTRNLELADNIPTETETGTIGLLIGNDYYLDLILGYKIEVQPGFYLLSSRLGWILTGRSSVQGKSVSDVNMLVLTYGTNIHNTEVFSCIDESIPVKPSLEDFWKIESIGIYDDPRDSDDELAMKNFKDNLIFKDKRCHVTWPWINDNPNIESNRQLAVGRLKSLMGRLHSKSEIMKKYSSVIDDQLKNNIIEKVDESQNDGIRHYIPHHPVIKPDRSTTKLRVVYDASAKVKPESKSLNESLYRGPVLLQDLCGILLRFRLNKVAIVSDIEKAFLQICLQPSERDVTRFLWMKDINRQFSYDNLQEYRFCRVPFGVISSPFLLSATVNHHLDQYKSEMSEQIKRDIYMDNVITGTNTVSEGVELYQQSKKMFSEASMNLREWVSNSEEVMDHIPEPDRATDDSVKVLGLIWNPKKDDLRVTCTKKSTESVLTKRHVLKQLASVFDPLGFLSPIVLRGKLFLQTLWSKHLDWDDDLSEEDSVTWKDIREDLTVVSDISVRRWVVNQDCKSMNYLVCFCDASEKAYAAVVYLVQKGKGQCNAEVIFSKSRLNPTTSTSIPRLELLAVVIGVRCLSFVKEQLSISVDKSVLFSDSQCVLKWIITNKKLPVFVQNRVNEIRKHEDVNFHYVKSVENPADLASRGCDLESIKENELWWNGPTWLGKEEKEWPKDIVQADDTKEETELQSQVTEEGDDEQKDDTVSESKCFPFRPPLDIDVGRYSTAKRLLRVTATALQYVDRFKGKTCSSMLGPEDMNRAEGMWIRYVQISNFKDVFEAINGNKKNNLLLQLGLYIDEAMILRCKGRLENSSLSEGARQPILLPRENRFTELMIEYVHQKCQHSGVSQTLSVLRQRFWIPRGRATVRKVLNKCQTCRRLEGGAYKMPPFAPLPRNRVSEAPPFSCTGIDYMGPMYIKEDNQQKKVWICLFTCMVVRAVHLELVSDMSTEAFLNCLRRFIACRGVPREIICDNAMQFKLASETLDLVWGDIVRGVDVQSYCANESIKWNFIVELAPWMGGFYERMVGLIKRSLRKAIGRNLLDRDKLNPIVKEAEAVVNSRPLIYVGEDINSTFAITPGHFTCLNPKIGIPDHEDMENDPDFKLKDSSADKLLGIWKKGQKLLDKFWLIWREEYLTSLRERSQRQFKSCRVKSVDSASVGDVVLIKDAVPRGCWRFGRIVELVTSKDGCVRSAKVRTSSGNILGRPLCLLYPIETSARFEETSTVEKPVEKTEEPRENRSKRQASIQANTRIQNLYKMNSF